MENTTTLSKEDKTKKRQVGTYIQVPIFDLEDAINVAKIISKIGGGKLDSELLAKSMDLSNSTVRHHINSAKHYQIVETDNDMVKITEVGKGIVNPKSNEECTNNKIKAFLSCDLYNRIYDRYNGKDLPPMDILANIFARDEGVSFKTKGRTAANFIRSGITAGLIKQENDIYHCVESIGKEKEVVDKTKVIPEKTSIESPIIAAKGIDEIREITETKEITTKTTPSLGKIKISAEPFFEVYISPDEKAFDALMQLLPYYKEVYCKKVDDSLQR